MRAFALLAASSLPVTAWAHGFDERYDLPAPLGFFVAGAALTVALSFVVAVRFARSAPAPASVRAPPATGTSRPGRMIPALRWICRLVSFLLFAVTLVAALWGTADPMMNLAPTLVWIVWWVGLSLLVACVGNVWPVLDPWRTLFEGIDALARRAGRPAGISFGWRWPRALGVWPAVALLLAWSWLEVVYPVAAVPTRLGCAMLVWSGLTLIGMVCFGRETWQRNADVFALYFAMLGRMAPLASDAHGRRIVVRAPGAGLIADQAGAPAPPAGASAFVIAMLSTVLFDGLHGGQAWLLHERLLTGLAPRWMDINGYFAGTVGLVGVWLLFYAAYESTCRATARLVTAVPAALIARHFAPTLVPIAVAYNVAHNFSSLLIQGQNAIPLLSDPLGWRWDLFGTAGFRANIGIVDARLTWTVAIFAIVTGHVIAVWLAHRVALREAGTTRGAALASIPLTALMVAYTAISLAVIAEPMVTFVAPIVAVAPVASPALPWNRARAPHWLPADVINPA